MVIGFHTKKQQRNRGFVLSELMVSTSVFSAVSMVLLMGFTSLERSYTASGDFAIEDLPGRGRKPAFSPSGSSVNPCLGV